MRKALKKKCLKGAAFDQTKDDVSENSVVDNGRADLNTAG